MSEDKEVTERRRRKESTLRVRVRFLSQRGLTVEQAAAEIGITAQEAHRLISRKKARIRPEALNRHLWLEFIGIYLEEGQDQARFNGFPLSGNQARSLHRWRNEGATPMFFGVDSFLTASDLHINDFLNFCEHQGMSPWARGVAPDWEKTGLIEA
jgi:hypothetical protein